MSAKVGKGKIDDDGRTVVSMDFEAIATYKHPRKKPVSFYREKQEQLSKIDITPKERWAMIKAVYIYVIPFALVFFGVLALGMFLLLKYWTR